VKRGVLVFAHNNRQVDYAKMAIVAGGLAKKHLNVPVSLVTDQSTVDWMNQSGLDKQADKVFSTTILVDRPADEQQRRFSDGEADVVAPFKNSNRASVYDLTPYETTLVIDSDYLIQSDELNNYWDLDSNVMISPYYNDIKGDRVGPLDKWVSETGVWLRWATMFMFKKSPEAEMFFNLVAHIRENYKSFADTYRYDPRMYRNDISFSIARHIMYGFETDCDYALPPVLSVPDMDYLYTVDDDKLKFLMRDTNDYTLCTTKGRDIHVMNKQSIIRNIDKLMEML